MATETNVPNERGLLVREQRELITHRLSPFAIGWLGTVAIWVAVFASEGRLTPAAVLVVGAEALLLMGALWLCRSDPAAPRVLPLVLGTCVALGAASTALVAITINQGEIVAFMLLTLYIAAALLFGWGWLAELVLLVTTLAGWALVFDRFVFVIRPLEVAAAVTVGALLALAIAEGAARSFRYLLVRRWAQARITHQLEDSRDAYRDLAEHARDLIWACDLKLRLTYVNEAAIRFLGLPATAILGRPIPEFYSGNAGNPDASGIIARAVAVGELPPFLAEIVTPLGPRWIEVVSSLVRDQRGAPSGLRGISRDVSERVAAATALRESEERFRSAFDHAAIGMVVVGLDGKPLQLNRAFCEMLGYEPAELETRTMDTLVHPADVARARSEIGRLLRGEVRVFQMEMRHFHKEGHVVWCLCSCSLTSPVLGRPIHIIAQLQDISERKAAADALRTSEARYRGLVESQQELIVRMDTGGRFTFVNDAYVTKVGKSQQALLGHTNIDLVHPDDHGLVSAAMKALAQAPYRVMLEIRNFMADGIRWIAWESCMVVYETGRLVEVQAVGRDVTERRSAEEALRGSLADLKHSEETLRLLAQRQVAIREEERKRLGFDLHDDVCQELVGVGILVAALRRKLAPMSVEYAAEFDRVVGYLGEVVEHLRVLSRELRPLLLRELGLDGSLLSLADGMSSPTLQVVTDFQATIPRLDEEAEVSVYRIAQEALANAVRHAGASRVIIALAAADGMLHLEVCDDGRGFDHSARPAVALGLASMEERALALGGRLEICSAPGEGTTVALDCPLDARILDQFREPADPSPTRSSSLPSTTTTPRSVARD